MALEVNIIRVAKEILKTHIAKIPASLHGVDKQVFLGNEVLPTLPEKHKIVLQKLLNHFLMNMRESQASDIDLGGWGSQQKIWVRVHGRKKPLPELGEYLTEETDLIVQNLLTQGQRFALYDRRALDFSYTLKSKNGDNFRYRASAYFDLESISLNLRAINNHIIPFRSYGFPPQVARVLSLAHTHEGLILVTGITGSGKSTTLDAIVDMNNRNVDGHIVIIASPVEFIHRSKRCIVKHREVGIDTLSFKRGTIEALRQDPDIIIIGEMRDPETILAALEVADSGHKVFSTLHTSSAVESLDRIIGEVPPVEHDRVRYRLADILRCVISQKLVPSLDGKRVLATEIMVMSPSIRAAIKNNNTGEIYQMISEGHQYGMHTMEQDLRRLYQERKIDLDIAFNFANNKRRMRQLMHGKMLLKSG